MPLKIAVVKNHLPSCPSPYVVRSGPADVVEYERFVEIMAQGRTTLTKTEILGCMQLYGEELVKLLSEGRAVKTPTGSFFLSAAGSMDSLDESFLPSDLSRNHDVRLHHRTGKSFEDSILAKLVIVREERPDFGVPNIRAVRAAGSETPDSIHPGDIVEIRGLRLRFDQKDANQGLFFVDGAGAETRATLYPMNRPGTVMACVPETLAAGSYTLALRAAVNGKDVRETRLEGLAIGASAPPP
jgi:hypothetical protein